MQIRIYYRWKEYLHIPVNTKSRGIIATKYRGNMVFQDSGCSVEILRPLVPHGSTPHAHAAPKRKARAQVYDARLGAVCTTECAKTIDDYFRVTSLTFSHLKEFLDWLRMQSGEPGLRITSPYNLEVIDVTTLEGETLKDWKRDFRKWSKNPHERPLPLVRVHAWSEARKALASKQQVPLFQTLLYDAQIELERDPRNAILYADMACKDF